MLGVDDVRDLPPIGSEDDSAVPVGHRVAAAGLRHPGDHVAPGAVIVIGIQLEPPGPVGEVLKFPDAVAKLQAAGVTGQRQQLKRRAAEDAGGKGAVQLRHIVVGGDLHARRAPAGFRYRKHAQRDILVSARIQPQAEVRDDLGIHQGVAGQVQRLQQRDLQFAGVHLAYLHVGGVRALARDGKGAGQDMRLGERRAVHRALDPVPLDRARHGLFVFLRYRVHYNSSISTDSVYRPPLASWARALRTCFSPVIVNWHSCPVMLFRSG